MDLPEVALQGILVADFEDADQPVSHGERRVGRIGSPRGTGSW